MFAVRHMPEFVFQRVQLGGHAIARIAQAANLVVDAISGDEVVLNVDAAGCHQHCAAYGHAPRHRQAEDLDAHGTNVAEAVNNAVQPVAPLL